MKQCQLKLRVAHRSCGISILGGIQNSHGHSLNSLLGLLGLESPRPPEVPSHPHEPVSPLSQLGAQAEQATSTCTCTDICVLHRKRNREEGAISNRQPFNLSDSTWAR